MISLQESKHYSRLLTAVVALFLATAALYFPAVSSGHTPVGFISTPNPYTLEINGSVTLSSNITSGNLIVEPGAVLDTNGYSIVLNGTFTNLGTVTAGLAYNPGDSYPESYGGSGGGDVYQSGICCVFGAGATRASAGINSNAGYTSSVNGSSPAHPVGFSSAMISTWWSNGIKSYLIGASGAGGYGYYDAYRSGGSGSYGLYIQANRIVAGTIDASGQSVNSSDQTGTYLSTGAGGGGVIVLAYGNGGYSPGTYNVSGGTSAVNPYNSYLPGGSGGNGMLLTLNYSQSTVPVVVHFPNLDQNLFDGAYAKYSVNFQETDNGANTLSLSGSASYKVENVSFGLNQASVQYNYSVPGSSIFSGSTQTSSNITLSSLQVYNSFMLINQSNIVSLDHSTLPQSLAILLGFEISPSGIPLAGVSAVNTSISTPAGNYYADEISGTISNGGSEQIWISPDSGILIKAQGTEPLNSQYSTHVTYTLTSTNFPLVSVQPSYLSYIIVVVVLAAIVAGLLIADRMGYIDLRAMPGKVKRSLSKEEKTRKEKIAKLDNLRRQNLISEEEYNEKIQKLK